MKTSKVIAGGTGPGSTSYIIPMMLKEMLGAKIKVIGGYKGSKRTVLAMEQGEHHGTGFNWLAWSSIAPHWFAKKYGGTAEPGKEFAFVIEWHGETDVHQVRAAEIRIINDINITFLRRQRLTLFDEIDQHHS